MVIGPRIWKTGISVALCIFLVQLLNLESPLLAVVAAVITIQPSITKSIVHGGNRAIATLIGGAIGLIVLLFFGAHPITVGLAVILAIVTSIKFNLQQQGVVITTITVVAVMVNVTGDPKFFALYRLVETLLGIGVGVAVNLIFSPPNAEKYLVQGLVDVNQRLKNLYVSVVNGFIFNQKYDQEKTDIEISEIRKQLEDTRIMVFEFKDEIGYRKMQKNQVKKYETIINGLNLIFERILGIYYTETNRSNRNISIEGNTKEYKDILDTLQKLLTITVSLQDNLLSYLTDKNSNLSKYLDNCSNQSNDLIKELRNHINHWHLQEENKNKALSLMELSNIGYEMEQISHYLNKISEALKELTEKEEAKTAS